MSERDITELKSVYDRMMTYGRGLDAVYVAFAIEVIENGGDMSVFRKLENSTPNLLGN